MARYIDADKVSENLKRYLMPNVDIDGTVTVEVAERHLLELINKTPTADVVEVKHGEWESYNTECSICKRINPTLFLDELFGEYKALHLEYCPHCGAKMDAVNYESTKFDDERKEK